MAGRGSHLKSIRYGVTNEALAEVLGTETVNPADLMKRLAAYIRNENLAAGGMDVSLNELLKQATGLKGSTAKRSAILKAAYQYLDRLS